LKYSKMSLYKCFDCKSVHHSLMRGLMWKGGAHAASQLAFMVSLNKPY
jgi:hypothetical protein